MNFNLKPHQEQIIEEFSNNHNIDLDSIEELPQDASFRKYYRIISKNSSYILMDCNEDRDNFLEFFNVQRLLEKNNIFVPKILLIDNNHYTAILQDLGNVKIKDTFKGLSTKGQYDVYLSILEILSNVQKINVPAKFPSYFSDRLLLGIKTFLSWYLPYRGIEISNAEQQYFLNLWQEAFKQLSNMKPVINLLDFHVENIMLTDNKLALIDFQDAALCWPSYDLVSLLQDARHEINYDDAQMLLEHYCKINSFDPMIVKLDYNILGAQRNSRILGVFARKYLKDQTDKYLQYIPLVVNYLKQNLETIDNLQIIKVWLIEKELL